MISFEQITVGPGKYVRITIDDGTERSLPCAGFSIALQANGAFELRHRQLHAQINFRREDIAAPASTDDADLLAKLTTILNCACCGAGDCPDTCIAPPGFSFLFFSFLPGNQLDDVSQVLTNVRAGFGPCDDPCFELFSGLNMTPVTGRGDFVNQVVNYIAANPPPGFVSALPSESLADSKKVVIIMGEQNCCDQPLYILCDQFSCDEGPFDPEFYLPSAPEYNCCSAPIPCPYFEGFGQIVFDFSTFPPGSYTPGTYYISTGPDCFIQVLGSDPTSQPFTPLSAATFMANALFANIGMGSGATIVDVNQDGTTVTIKLSENCCGDNVYFGSNNAGFHAALGFIASPNINCCP